LKDIK